MYYNLKDLLVKIKIHIHYRNLKNTVLINKSEFSVQSCLFD